MAEAKSICSQQISLIHSKWFHRNFYAWNVAMAVVLLFYWTQSSQMLS